MFDPGEATLHLSRVDDRLAQVIAAHGPFTMRPSAEVGIYESLVRSIVFQQLSGKAAATILSRLLATWGGRFPTPAELLEADLASLRSAGVSRNKALALHDLSARALDGTVPTLAQARQLEDEELVQRLVAVRGIGRWTVEMLLMFRLGRPDVLPVADLGVRKGFQLTFDLDELPRPALMQELAEPWRPYRSVGSWYMWRLVDGDPLPGW